MTQPIDEEKNKLLEISLTELKGMLRGLTDVYNQTKNKTLTFMSGGLAFLAFLYSGKDHFLPANQYGQIIYFGALAAVVIGIVILFYATQPVTWEFPPESKVMGKNKFADRIEMNTYLIDQYVDALRINGAHCDKKQKYLNFAFPLMIIGAILLIVIKNFP